MRHLFIVITFLLTGGSTLSAQVIIDGIPRDTSFTVYSTYIKESKKRTYIKIVKPLLPDNVIAKDGIIYSTPSANRSLHLNIYRPDDEKKYPALLMIHGGGWSSGDLSLQIPMAEQIAAKGYVTIPVEYRLSPEAIYPAAVHDLKTALRWIRANADQYGIDTTRIAVSGCSAGGQLATLLGVINGQASYEGLGREYSNHTSNVHAVINIDGISDFTTKESLDGVLEAISKNKVSASVKWFGTTYDENKEPWIEASPVYWVTKESAPVCFINSSIPRFHGGRDELIEKLTVYNISTEIYSLPDTPHPFWLFEPWFEPTVKYMTDYLDKVF
ncbi:acetyl esterase/lipase [Dysgonomonas alginatilytica]|uniref:Acetyl esterase/lipase n=1 Tax=Dysgonomonas alginatilytica TaxID=1605892 RepID=A0A2V3PNR3_9BACT|nr:alpha/beta hydrolase [Dysgonomonas alginatilytica]PXV63588.1 acetyl esterase/lipase [Dysgonomonas alginatilytica]